MNGDCGIRKTCRRWNTPWEAHELTFSCYRRQPFLTRDRTRQYLAQAVRLAREKHGFHLWAYVVMPEHVHLLLWPAAEEYDISAILRSIKQSVSRRAVAYLRANHPAGLARLVGGRGPTVHRFWQEGGGYDRNVRTKKEAAKFLNYIHNNPVKRGLVAKAADWTWSSCRDWEGLGDGPIPLDKESLVQWV